MSSKGQVYLRCGSLFQLPVSPDKINVTYGSNNDSMQVCGIGEVTFIRDTKACVVQFSSFFPATYFSGCDYRDIPSPGQCVAMVNAMRDAKAPILLVVIGDLHLIGYVSIENFVIYEQGGDVDTIYYTLTLKEYRTPTIRQISVDVSARKAQISQPAARVESGQAGQSYTVVKGDCLWNIAKKYYGNGSKHTVIYEANKETIENAARAHKKSSSSNGHWIYPGTVLNIPAA